MISLIDKFLLPSNKLGGINFFNDFIIYELLQLVNLLEKK